MNNYSVRIKIREGEVKAILDRLNAAQQVIYDCYNELRNLGVLVIEEKTVSGN